MKNVIFEWKKAKAKYLENMTSIWGIITEMFHIFWFVILEGVVLNSSMPCTSKVV